MEDISARNQAQLLGQGFGTGARCDPEAVWYAVALFSGQSFETLEALLLAPSDLVPKLTVSATTPKGLSCVQERHFSMKTVYLVLLTLAAFSAGPCSAQEIKTVGACRAYREAWYTSVDEDVRRLSVRELVQRANQMMMCGKEIDNQPFTTGMTMDGAVKMGLDQLGYPILSSRYMQEAFNRASWFIENRGLTVEFLAADRNGKILRQTR